MGQRVRSSVPSLIAQNEYFATNYKDNILAFNIFILNILLCQWYNKYSLYIGRGG